MGMLFYHFETRRSLVVVGGAKWDNPGVYMLEKPASRTWLVTFVVCIYLQKVKVGNGQEMAQTERNSLSKNRSGKLSIRYLY